MKQVFSFSLACVLAGAAYQNGFGQENYSLWASSKPLVINTAPAGYNIASTLNNFPYVVRLSHKSFTFSEANGRGADIRFANATGVHLPYEIELWDSANARAAIWVKVDRIAGNNSTQYITMYWGRAAAADSSNGRAVFDTANGFSGVWHMNETPSGSGSIRDRTRNVYNGTPTASMDASRSVDGPVGRALEFDGTGDYITLPTISTNFTAGLTVCGWMKFRNLNNWSRLIDFGNGQANSNILFANSGGSNGLRWAIWNGTAVETPLDIADFFLVGEWEFVCGTYDGSTMAAYKNGVSAGSMANPNGMLAAGRTSNFIARSNWGADALYDGQIDEVEVSKVARSADWIKLCYLNQKMFIEDPPTLIYSPKNYIDTINTYIAPIIPTIGGVIDSIRISPPLWDYLVFDNLTGTIVGWTDVVHPRTTFYITAYNAAGPTTDTITITFTDGLTATAFGTKQAMDGRPRLLGASRSLQPKIFFLVPASSRVSELRFTLYTIKGTAVWSKMLCGGQLRSGIQSLCIDAKSGGVYFMEMTGRSAGQKILAGGKVRLLITQ